MLRNACLRIRFKKIKCFFGHKLGPELFASYLSRDHAVLETAFCGINLPYRASSGKGNSAAYIDPSPPGRDLGEIC